MLYNNALNTRNFKNSYLCISYDPYTISACHLQCTNQGPSVLEKVILGMNLSGLNNLFIEKVVGLIIMCGIYCPFKSQNHVKNQ